MFNVYSFRNGKLKKNINLEHFNGLVFYTFQMSEFALKN